MNRIIRKMQICFALLLFSSSFILAQNIFEKKIEYYGEGKSLDIVLSNLRMEYNLKFEYDPEDIKGIKIDAWTPRLKLPVALKRLLRGTKLSFELQSPNLVILTKGVEKSNQGYVASKFQPELFDITITGVVRDFESGETLPFANLLVVGTSAGNTTNVDGYFSLFNVPNDTALIEISYLGYRTQYFRCQPGMDFEELNIQLAPSGQMLEEIQVSATKKEQMMQAATGISKISVSPAQLSAIPSLGEKDIFRSLQLLPGVSGSNESSSGLYVRGGTPDQNLVWFDGFTVYHVDHLFGFFSAFNSQAIKDVQLHKGGFESKYGGRTSSVVDITGKNGNSEKFNIGGNLSLISANAFAEIPFAKGKGTILLAGRRSFSTSFYKNILNFSGGEEDTGSDDEEEEPAGPPFASRGFANTEPTSWFYDLNGKITYQANKDIFSLSIYNGKDKLDNGRNSDDNAFGGGGPFGGGAEIDLNFKLDVIDESDWGNTGISSRWSRKWSDKVYSNAQISYSNYFSTRDRGTFVSIERDTSTNEVRTGTNEDNDLKDFSFKWDWEWQAHPNHKIGIGLNASYLDIKYDFIENDTTVVLARDDQGFTNGLYLQSQSTFFDKLIIKPGIRLSYFSETSELYYEPRIQFQYLLSDRIKLKAASGRYYQFANRIIREDISQGSRDFWILSDNDNVPVGSSDHFILGLGYETNNYLFDAEVYHKNLDNITEYSTRFTLNGFGPNSTLSFDENFYTGTGTAKGVELLAQKKSGSLTGWLSYTLGQVTHEFDVFGDPFPAAHDVTNEVKLVAMYKSGNWSFGGTFVYATGKPYTAPLGAYSLDVLDGEQIAHFAVSNKNTLRLPDYHRLDLSINYDIDYIFRGKGTIGLSLFNVYNNKNVWYKEFDVVENQIIETDVNLLGFTPSFYFNWKLR